MVELTIPSVCYVLGMILFVGIAFLIESKMTPYMLAILSGIILVVGVQEHYSQFNASEYRAETWTEHIRQAGPYYFFSIVIGIALVVYIVTSTSIGSIATSALGFAGPAGPAGPVSPLVPVSRRRLRSG
jgi:uncharacterized membrane protein